MTKKCDRPTKGIRTAVLVWCELKNKPRKCSDIGASLGLTPAAVMQSVGALERVGVAVHDGFSPCKGPPARTFRLARLGDDPTNAACTRVMDYEDRLGQIVGLLSVGASKSRIHAEVSVGDAELIDIIERLRAAKLVHRSGWLRIGRHYGQPGEVFALGNAPDVPRPLPQTNAQTNARHAAKRKLIEQAAGFSVFSAHAFEQMQGVA